MTTRDLISKLEATQMIAAEELSADNTPPAVDRQGYHSAMIVLAVGAGGITFDATNKIEFKLTESDDDSTYTAVAEGDIEFEDGSSETVDTGGIIKSLVAAHATAAVYRFGYKGNKRYLKLLADFSGTHGTGTPIAAVLVQGHPNVSPIA